MAAGRRAAATTSGRFLFHAAVYVLLERAGTGGEAQVLLLRRRGTGYADGWLSLPSGHLDGGETVPQAAAREAAEELGVVLPLSSLRVLHCQHRPSVGSEGRREYLDYLVSSSRWDGVPRNAEPEKASAVSWHARDSLPADLLLHVRAALDAARAGRPFSQFGWEEPEAEG